MNRLIKNKNIICLMLVVSIIVTGMFRPVYAATSVGRNAPYTTSLIASSDKYSSNWIYWLQGASRYGSMGNYGCHIVAYSKLLAECGCPLPSGFNPDTLYNWARGTKYNGLYYIRSDCYETNCAGYGRLPIKYAETLGYKITYVGRYDISTLSEKEKPAEIMKYINSGYYVILGHKNHFTYVAREESLARNTAVVSDSRSIWSYDTRSLFNYSDYAKTWKNYPHYTDIICYSVAKTAVSLPEFTQTTEGTMKLAQNSSERVSEYKLDKGQSLKLKFYGATGYDGGRDASSITWTSSNTRIATVDKNGNITAVGCGMCRIKCSVKVSATNTIYSGSALIRVSYITPTPTPESYKPFAVLTATPTPVDLSGFQEIPDALVYLMDSAEDISDDTYGFEKNASVPYADLYIETLNEALQQVNFMKANHNKLHVIAAAKNMNITKEDIAGVYELLNSGKNKAAGENYVRNGRISIKMDELYYYIILN